MENGAISFTRDFHVIINELRMKWILMLWYHIIWQQLDALLDSSLYNSKAILNTSWSIVEYGEIITPNNLIV